MGYDFRSLCQVEAKRLVLLIVLVFASAIAVQYVELPYSIQSIFSAEKSQVTEIITFSNTNDTIISHNSSQVSHSSEEKNIEVKNESVAEKNGGPDPEDEPFSKASIQMADNSTTDSELPVNAFSPTISPNVSQNGNNYSVGSSLEGDSSMNSISPSPPPLLSLLSSAPNISSVANVNISPMPLISIHPNPSEEKATENISHNGTKSGELQRNAHRIEKRVDGAMKGPVSISEMNDLLLQSRVSSFSVKPRWSSGLDKELWNAKLQIENAPVEEDHPGLYAPLFRNVSMFKRSYELMEQMLKVYVYKDGERPIFHTPVLKGIYASEGWFMKLLKANKHFVTKNPRKAHLFYLPFSSRMLEETLYVPNSHSRRNLVRCLSDYLNVISSRYRFWNRTSGSDHFLVACHDWAPSETSRIMANSIRALCNSDVKEGFKFGKDVSLPETYIRNAQNPLRELGGKPPSQRKILSFFAGNMHGYLRPILLQYWENKDPDMKIFGKLPKSKGNANYIQHMKSSKYCICAKGYEVNSPRVVEAIFYECVPVIISDDFVPPFFDFLNWESFAVIVPEKEIPYLKKILLSIPSKRYLEMYKRVKQVQRHFLWHVKPVKYDIFHMILHSIWYNRVFQMRPT